MIRRSTGREEKAAASLMNTILKNRRAPTAPKPPEMPCQMMSNERKIRVSLNI